MHSKERDQASNTKISLVSRELTADELICFLTEEREKFRINEEKKLEEKLRMKAEAEGLASEKRLKFYRRQKEEIEANLSNPQLPVLMKELFKLILAREDIIEIDLNSEMNLDTVVVSSDDQYEVYTHLPTDFAQEDFAFTNRVATGERNYETRKVTVSFKFTFDQQDKPAITMTFSIKDKNEVKAETYLRTASELSGFIDLLFAYLVKHQSPPFSPYSFITELQLTQYKRQITYQLR